MYHVGVRDELDAEGPLALALVAVLEVALHRHRLPRLLVRPKAAEELQVQTIGENVI